MNLSIIKDTVNEFKEIQRYMQLAKKENATETYAELKIKYSTLKAALTFAGMNLTEIDMMKE